MADEDSQHHADLMERGVLMAVAALTAAVVLMAVVLVMGCAVVMVDPQVVAPERVNRDVPTVGALAGSITQDGDSKHAQISIQAE